MAEQIFNLGNNSIAKEEFAMRIVRWQPFRELDNVSSMMRRFFDDVNDGFPTFEIGNFVPNIDMSEDEKNVMISAELPGLDKEDVKITVNDENVLTIRGEKKRQEKVEKTNYYRLERSFGEFVRTITLPAEVKADEINAKFDKGLLTVSIPKKVPAKPKELEVQIS